MAQSIVRRGGAVVWLAALALGLSCPRAAHAADVSPPPAKPEEVIVVFKTHFDIGYTDLARTVVQRYRTEMIDKALAVADQSKDLPPENRFVWTLSGWPMKEILGPEQTPARRKKIVDAIRDGRLVWHALPATLHTESLDLEDLVRRMRFSSDLSRSLALPLPRDAKMTDVAAHMWLLPTVLVRAGVEFLHLGCNAASTSPEVPTLFWWEGPDGSRLLTMYSAGDYGTGLAPPKDWPYATWLALIHTGDNQGPPDAGAVRGLLDRAAREMPGVKVRMGRLSDFSDAIRREKAQIPIIRGDMPDSWVHGIMSMPQETRLARNVRPAIGALESLNRLLGFWGVNVPSEKDAVAAACERSLLYGEHTWGIDFKRFGKRVYGKEWEAEHAAGKYKLAEESWAEHGDYARAAAKLIMLALDSNMKALAAAIQLEGPRIVAYNPLPWARDEVLASSLPSGAPDGLVDLATGEKVPVQRDGTGTGFRFLARGVPPMGYKTYVAAKAAPVSGADELAADQKSATIENAFFRVRVDSARGGIASIVEKRTGRELVDASEFAFGQYVYERFDADQVAAYIRAYCKIGGDWVRRDYGKADLPPANEKPRAVRSPKDWAVEVSQGPLAVTATLRAKPSDELPHEVALCVALYRNEPWVDLEWSIQDKPADPWPEAGWLALPLKVEPPGFLLGRTGSVVDPARDIVRGASHVAFCLNTGLAATGPDGAGVGLCPADSPTVSLERRGIFQFSKDVIATKPLVWINLYNNAFGVNFQQWIGGSWSSRVRLWSVAAGENAAERLMVHGWETRQPCRVATSDGPAGTLPPSRAGIELSRRGVLVTTFGPNPDGAGTLLRLWEQAGRDETCRVKLPDGLRPKKAQPVDLRGRPVGDAITVQAGEFAAPMTHFAPVSLLLP
jgi:hypothetical protein